MPTVDLATRDIKRHARRASERAVREASPWIEALGRFGHAAIGLVYATIGMLAAQAALGRGGGTTDSQGALAWLVQRPHGHALLVALAVGLAGYAAWRVVEAILDTESKGSDPKGIAARLVYAGIGATYAALALSALRLGLQWADGDGAAGTPRRGIGRPGCSPSRSARSSSWRSASSSWASPCSSSTWPTPRSSATPCGWPR